MAKDINLFSEDLLPGYGPVQLPYFVATLLIAMLLAALFIASTLHTRQQLVQEKLRWQSTADRQAAALTQYQMQNPNLQNSDELAQQNTVLAERLAINQGTLNSLSLQLGGNFEGFSGALQQLNDYDLDGLWLDNIEINGQTNSFTLSGYAQSPELIPSYLSQLGQTRFQGVSVSQLSVTKAEPEQTLWRFSLSNAFNPQVQGVR